MATPFREVGNFTVSVNGSNRPLSLIFLPWRTRFDPQKHLALCHVHPQPTAAQRAGGFSVQKSANKTIPGTPGSKSNKDRVLQVKG